MKKIIPLIILMLSIGTFSIFANEMEQNTDRPGNDYRYLEEISVQDCSIACDTEDRCKSWTFVKPNTIQGPKSKCYLKSTTPTKVYNQSCISGLSNVSYEEVQRVVADSGRHVRFQETALPVSLFMADFHKLEDIIDVIKRNGNTKLYISIKKKAAGLANKRVKKMKDLLAHLGLSPSLYHVQKLTKKEKKKNWLSKNNHLWMKVGPKRN